jgi:hypothetical protein
MGAGWAISEGKNALELTAANATKKIRKINKGAMYCRKKAIGIRGYLNYDESLTVPMVSLLDSMR